MRGLYLTQAYSGKLKCSKWNYVLLSAFLIHDQRNFLLQEIETNMEAHSWLKFGRFRDTELSSPIGNFSIKFISTKFMEHCWREERKIIKSQRGSGSRRKQGLINTTGPTHIYINTFTKTKAVCTGPVGSTLDCIPKLRGEVDRSSYP